GSGKTSLVRAGLIPRLRAAGWTVHSLRLGRRAAESWDTVPAAATERTALFLDQFEEAFHQPDPEQPRGPEERLLAWVSREPVPGLIAARRADYYGDLMGTPRLWARFGRSHDPVPPLDEEGLRQSIIGPALAVGVHLDPRLVDAVIADADPVRQP